MNKPKRPVNRILTGAIVILTAAWLTTVVAASYQVKLPSLPNLLTEHQPGLYRVTSVADGDTIEVDLGGYRDTVRMIGVDTPETKDPRKPVQCYGEAASAFTKDLLRGQRVRLEADPADSDRDKYQRLLRYVYLPDGRLVNAEIIRQGYGFAYTIFPYAKLDEFRALELEAREAGRGLWSSCEVNESKEVKQTATQ